MDSSNSTILDEKTDAEEESSLTWDAFVSSRAFTWAASFVVVEGVLLLLGVVFAKVLNATIIGAQLIAVVILIAILSLLLLVLSVVYRLTRASGFDND